MEKWEGISGSILVGLIIILVGVIYGGITVGTEVHEIQCDGFYVLKDTNKIVVGDTSYSSVNSDISYHNGTLKFSTMGKFNSDAFNIVLLGIGFIVVGIIFSCVLSYLEQKRINKKYEKVSEKEEE